MPHKPKAKIYQFPGSVKPTSENDRLEALKEALSDSKPAKIPRSTRPRAAQPKTAPPMPTNAIFVDGNGFANLGSIGTINYYGAEKQPEPTVVVQTGVGVIDAAQKRQITNWVRSVVKAGAARNPPKTYGSVWNAFKDHMKVSKYDEILAIDFEKAKKWLLRSGAISSSLPSASKKIADWRNRRIKAIHARCKEIDITDWRIAHMKKKFGKESMLDLPDDDLEALYRTVMNKKLS